MKILLVIVITFILGCSPSSEEAMAPKAKYGVLDLRDWNPDNTPLVALDGLWKIQPLHPNYSTESFVIQVPSAWNSVLDKKGSGQGIYKLTILLPENIQERKDLAIELNDVSSAFELSINGTLIHKKGRVAANREEMRPSYKRPVILLGNLYNELQIELNVSNFYHPKGGIRSSIYLGKTKAIYQKNMKKSAIMWLLVGATFIMGLYHLIIYWMRKSDQSSLWFGLFSIQVGFRAFFDNNAFFYTLFSDEYWTVIHKLDVAAFSLTLPLFSLFVYSIFPKDFNKIVLRIFVSAGLLFTAIIFLTQSNFYMISLNYFEVFVLVAILYFLIVMFVSVKKKRDGALLFLVGSIVLFATAVNDILNQMRILYNGFYANFGFLAFLLSQTTLLSRRYTLAFVHLEDLKSSLEEKVQSRTQELNTAKLNAENANNLKDKFLSLVSHDLRSPIASVIGLLNLIIDDGDDLSEEEKKDYIQKALSNSNHSLEMISQLLKMNRLRTGSLQLEPEEFDVYIELENVINKFWMQSGQKKVKLINSLPKALIVKTDRSLLGEIFLNLISNAIKFSHIGGKVIISFKEDSNKENLSFSVEDEGVGIDEQTLSDLFKSDVKTSQKGTLGEVGTGLGLPFVKEILNELGGDIYVKSKIGEGSKFVFSIPNLINKPG